MGSLANSSSLQTTIQDEIRCCCRSPFSQLSLLTLKPSPRLRLMPTTVITTVMASLTTGTLMLIMGTTMARGPLMLSPKLMPTTVTMEMALPTTGTVMVWLTTVTTVMLTLMLTDTTTARGPLMLSPLLMLTTVITTVMPHTVMLTAATTATLMLTVLMDTTTESNLLLFC